MTMTVTYACTCDNCGALVMHKTQPIEEELDIPRGARVFKMDLCEECSQLALAAVEDALQHRKRSMLRRSN